MCARAILNARIPRVYYGARDGEMGACGAVAEPVHGGFSPSPCPGGRSAGGEVLRRCCQFFSRLREFNTFLTIWKLNFLISPGYTKHCQKTFHQSSLPIKAENLVSGTLPFLYRRKKGGACEQHTGAFLIETAPHENVGSLLTFQPDQGSPRCRPARFRSYGSKTTLR